MNANINIFEIVKNIKNGAYDSYGMFNRRMFNEALNEQVKGIEKIELIHLIQDYRTASELELFKMDIAFFKHNTACGGTVNMDFETELINAWKEANKNVTRIITSGRCKKVIEVNDFGI